MNKNKSVFLYLAALLLQGLMFYIFPLFAGPTDAIGMVLILLVSCFIFSLLLGAFSGGMLKWSFPAAVSVLFIPSVFVYYNSSALVHALWCLVISVVSLGIGSAVRKIFAK